MIDNLISISITIFVFVFSGYILLILKEKIYLNNNIVFIEHKNLNEEDMKNLDIKHFMLGSTEIMAGDEVKIILENHNKLVGTVLGADKYSNTIGVVTRGSHITKLDIRSIRKLKVISRYGKFFTKF